MKRKCLKCGYENPLAAGTPEENCPGCGANYRRVEAMWGPIQPNGGSAPAPLEPAAPRAEATAAIRRPAALGAPAAPAAVPEQLRVPAYVEEMRHQTLYPTFRRVATIAHYLFLVVCLLELIIAVFGGFVLKSFLFGAGMIVLTILTYIISRAVLQASEMLADLSDSAVRMAARER